MTVLQKSGEPSKREAEQLLRVDLNMSLPDFSRSRSFNSHGFVHMLPRLCLGPSIMGVSLRNVQRMHTNITF